MNEEQVKRQLLDMILEAQDIEFAKKSNVLNTRAVVANDKVASFISAALNYYQLVNNKTLDGVIDIASIIEEVYASLTDELQQEAGEHYIDKGFEIVEETKKEAQQIEALGASLKTVISTSNQLFKEINSLSLAPSSLDTQKRIAELQEDFRYASSGMVNIREQIIAAKNRMNGFVLEKIKEEMEFMERAAMNSRVGTEYEVVEGKKVLLNDYREYQDLLVLSKILNNVKDNDDMVLVDNIVAVNPIQVDSVKGLLEGITLFGFVKPLPKEEVKEEKINDKLIKEISEYLTTLEVEDIANAQEPYYLEANDKYVLESNKEEYQNMLEILRILNKGNNSLNRLVPVWGGMAHVEFVDKERLELLLDKSKRYKDKNPDRLMLRENRELAIELEEYLGKLGEKKKSATLNSEIARTSDGRYEVLGEDLEEANTIIEIINMLKTREANLINVYGIANVSASNIPKFKDLVQKTKYFSAKVPQAKEGIVEQVERSEMPTLEDPKPSFSEPTPIAEEPKKEVKTEEKDVKPEVGLVPVVSDEEPILESDDTKEKGKIRKLTKDKAKDFFRNHKREIAIIGLAAAAMLMAPTVMQSVAVAASCTAAKFPATAGVMNVINTGLSAVSNLSFVNGTLYNAAGIPLTYQIAATNFWPAVGAATAKVAALGAGCFIGVKAIDSMEYADTELRDGTRITVRDRILDSIEALKSSRPIEFLAGLKDSIVEKFSNNNSDVIEDVPSEENSSRARTC